MLEQMDNIQIIQEMNIHAFSHCTLHLLSHARANRINGSLGHMIGHTNKTNKMGEAQRRTNIAAALHRFFCGVASSVDLILN